jgi:hypothetical protein
VSIIITELMSAMNQSATHKHDALREHRIHPVAQSMELQDRYKRAFAPCLVKPGDLCREKRGMVTFNNGPTLILWRWLDPEDYQDRLVIEDYIKSKISNRVDCMIGFIDEDAGHLVILPGESWRLEPIIDLPKMTRAKR